MRYFFFFFPFSFLLLYPSIFSGHLVRRAQGVIGAPCWLGRDFRIPRYEELLQRAATHRDTCSRKLVIRISSNDRRTREETYPANDARSRYFDLRGNISTCAREEARLFLYFTSLGWISLNAVKEIIFENTCGNEKHVQKRNVCYFSQVFPFRESGWKGERVVLQWGKDRGRGPHV